MYINLLPLLTATPEETNEVQQYRISQTGFRIEIRMISTVIGLITKYVDCCIIFKLLPNDCIACYSFRPANCNFSCLTL